MNFKSDFHKEHQLIALAERNGKKKIKSEDDSNVFLTLLIIFL